MTGSGASAIGSYSSDVGVSSSSQTVSTIGMWGCAVVMWDVGTESLGRSWIPAYSLVVVLRLVVRDMRWFVLLNDVLDVARI